MVGNALRRRWSRDFSLFVGFSLTLDGGDVVAVEFLQCSKVAGIYGVNDEIRKSSKDFGMAKATTLSRTLVIPLPVTPLETPS